MVASAFCRRGLARVVVRGDRAYAERAMLLKPRPFLELVLQVALRECPQPQPEQRLRASMAQLYFGSRAQHYEVWLRANAGLVEVGLHFEGPREENLRRLGLLADVMPLIGAALGPAAEIEEWTESWTRIHETQPLRPLDEAFAAALGHRIAAYVATLQPLIAPLGEMPPRPRHEHGEGHRWHGRRRGAAIRG